MLHIHLIKLKTIERQFNEGEVDDCYYETKYNPMFLAKWKREEEKEIIYITDKGYSLGRYVHF